MLHGINQSADGPTLAPTWRGGAAVPRPSPLFESGRQESTSPRIAMAVPELVAYVVAAFRSHPHLSNVLTHISGGSWDRIEQALQVILDLRSSRNDLSPLVRNIIDLMCADRGITGRIFKPYYQELLVALLGETVAKRLITHITCLFMEGEIAARQSAVPRWRNDQTSLWRS
ncbi:MAG: hypothetical protein AB7K64_21140 [Variibacter sp.]